MIEESGRVISIEDDFAIVETQRRSSCDACAVNKGCGTGVISKFYSGRFSQARAINEIGAKPGDEVVLGLHEEALVKSSLVVYAVPLLLLLLFAMVGEMLAKQLVFDNVDGLSGLFGVVGLIGGYLWVKRFSRNVSRDKRYHPVILRKLSVELHETTIQVSG